MTLAEDVVALQSRVAGAEREYNRAFGARETAKAVADNARDELARDFGVSTVAEAEQLLEKLRQELADLVAEMSRKLDGLGVQ